MLTVEAQKQIVNEYFQSTALFWSEIYTLPSLMGRIHQLRQASVLNLVHKLGLLLGAHALIVGCGAGLEAVALGRSGYDVQAIDAVSKMVNLTRRRAAEAGVQDHVAASVGDVDCLAFRNDLFELVLAVGVTPYLLSANAAVREVARVLRPGGHLIITAENRWSARQVLDPWLNPVLAPVRNAMRHFLLECGLRKQPLRRLRASLYSIRQFDTCLRTAGLSKIEGMTIGFGPFSFFGHRLLPDPAGVVVHNRLQGLSTQGFPVLRSAGSQYIVLAKKEANIAA